MKKLTHIGTTELVTLVDSGIKDVPAKIDTGADGSSIWASNVHIKGNKLIFNYFAPGSAFYRKQSSTTKDFKVTSVKSSFGHQEFRYKVKMPIKIGDHVLAPWFSLADRANSTYPILLGKDLLNNRFIVNVAQKFLVSTPNFSKKVLVLSSKPIGDYFEKVKKFNKLEVQYESVTYKKLIYYLNGEASKVLNTRDRDVDIARYVFTYFKSHASNPELASAAAEYLKFKGRPFADQEVKDYVSGSKLSQYMRLNSYNLPVPLCVCAETKLLAKKYEEIAASLGTPFVLKEANSDKGRKNYLVDNETDFTDILKNDEKGLYIAQKYIENDGFLRLYVLNKEVKLAIWRSKIGHKDKLKTHLNKPTGGVNAKLLKVSQVSGSAKDMAVRAAIALDRQVAGVDLVQDSKSKKWYILEANNAPQIKSGAFVDQKTKVIANYFDQELR
ncbi:MAG TPA: RimK/LysX family protein [Candidatus Saccharimonadales bacterium]|nr:RimK/LysX family protein [Candidatus Saccharimonadales bacterium]